MVDLAGRFFRFQRFLTPEAHNYLLDRPSLVDKLENLLDEGEELPMIISVDNVQDIDPKGDRERKASSPDNKDRAPEGQGTAPGMSDIPGKTGQVEYREAGRTGEMKGAEDPEISLDRELTRISRSVSDTIEAGKVRKETRAELRVRSAPGGSPRALASEYDGDMKILRDIEGSMGAQGRIDDFRKLFIDRYRSLKALLQKHHGDLHPLRDIGDLRGSEDTVRFIGMVESIRTTKNGHVMLNMDDPSGNIRVLLSKNKKELSGLQLVNDEVVGIIGKYKAGDGRGGPIVFVDQVLKVDIPGHHRRRLSSVKGLCAAFTSDVHIGSRYYLGKEWDRMVRWLRGEKDASLLSKDGTRVKYLVIAGDLVDGIGTYPDQDRDLVIKDIYGQYEALGESLSMLPDHVEVILIPGNHDAVRLAEPQPPLPKEYQECFSNSHIHFLSNPSFFSLHGVHVAGYHGKSMDDLVTLFKGVSYEDPIEGMKEMLRFRHFSPTYGMRNQISPEERDLLIIDEVPDIFVSGHVHRFGLDNYKGVQLIEGSAWQSQTPFQKMMSFKPQPAKMAVVELDLPNSMHRWELT